MVISGSGRPPVWAWCVGLALVSSAISGALFLLTTDGDLSAIFHVERLVGHAPENAELFRWAMLLDMLGYYVLLAPLFVAVAGACTTWTSKGPPPWTIGALMYVTAGSVAAMALAYGVPPLLRGYAQASGPQQQGFVIALTALGEAAVRGVWQTFDPVVTGAWAVATGLALGRLGHGFLGRVGVTPGWRRRAVCWLAGDRRAVRTGAVWGRGRSRRGDLDLRARVDRLAVEGSEGSAMTTSEAAAA